MKKCVFFFSLSALCLMEFIFTYYKIPKTLNKTKKKKKKFACTSIPKNGKNGNEKKKKSIFL